MIPRKETKWIIVSSTMTADRMTEQEVVWRARRYGYLDAGSHYIIDDNGTTCAHRPINLIGAGARPYNGTSIVIVLSGSFPYTERQMESLAALVLRLETEYPGAVVRGLNGLPSTGSDAPGFDVAAWLVGLRATAAL